MLIMLEAAMAFGAGEDLIRRHAPLLEKWAGYLDAFGEDPGEQLLRLPQAPAHQRKVQTDIFPAGPVRLKAGPEFQQRGYGPLQPDGAGARTGNSGKQLQKRGFSGSVPADDPHAFPSADPE